MRGLSPQAPPRAELPWGGFGASMGSHSMRRSIKQRSIWE